ncbi:MAG: hypothetical protein GFH27_549313n18 [Chloroflexi bacterium AL-W]|nr:hypothetical protein [Chloroflexi bacterium AL-N1]NOK69441.1 hypothetical protein [Chloroflexi bacterium AL-N10]NOK77406.1 hypothetical protein [Chloroflexi bacterium AL-N5]NOK84257.1 hypothetical protein [Chloroflexi bacterium AL-W]NOK91578.1 hypothetical protein [Chloroflexi bacterium AL-N15]
MVVTTLGFMFIGLLILVFTKRSKVSPQHPVKPRHPVAKGYSVAETTISRYPAKPRHPVATPTPAVTSTPYVRIPHLLTKAEQRFFHVLQDAVPDDLMICPQVRLANLVQVTGRYKRQYQYFNRIQAKCVDFVLCDTQSTVPLLVIELDDSSHRRQDRQKRDAFVNEILAQVRLPILHVKTQARYRVDILTREIRPMLANGQASPDPSQPKIDHPDISKKNASLPAPAQNLSPHRQHRFCHRCGSATNQQAKFCNMCGAPIHS